MKYDRVGRVAVAVLLILHALAHTAAGYWATGFGPTGIATALWLAAALGFSAGGLGLLGVGTLRFYWRGFVLVGAFASVLLLAGWSHWWLIPGIALDLLFGALAVWWRNPIAGSQTRRARIGAGFAWTFLIYLTAVIALRPWYARWGTTAQERSISLPGDGGLADPRYRIDRGVTIRARPEEIWPWMVQLGQDRGGFYSYDWLERLFGADIRNADRIHPEWQQRDSGDVVRAVQSGYLGGVFGDTLGWQITALDTNRTMILENWGTFALRPIDDTTTRLLIRTTGSGTPAPDAILVAPIGLLLFEPAHFIMERGMLLGIKQRAEHARLAPTVSSRRTSRGP